MLCKHPGFVVESGPYDRAEGFQVLLKEHGVEVEETHTMFLFIVLF
jgi:hypothetical protein